MKMTHLTLVNLEILTVSRGNFYHETIFLKLIEEEGQCQNNVLWLFFTSFR